MSALLLSGAGQAVPPGGLVVELAPARQSVTGSQDVVVTVTIRNTSRTWFDHCSNAQQESIAASVQAAQSTAQDGDACLRAGALADRDTGWFAPLDEARAATVSRHFEAIRGAFATRPITVDCACTSRGMPLSVRTGRTRSTCARRSGPRP